jgi:hypothetical protein
MCDAGLLQLRLSPFRFAEGRHPQDQRCAHGVRAPSSTEGEQQWHKAL